MEWGEGKRGRKREREKERKREREKERKRERECHFAECLGAINLIGYNEPD